MTIAVQIISILFMLTLMFIGIWSFIIANKAYNQLKYKNYLLEKVSSHLAIMTEKSLDDETQSKENIEEENISISEEEILNNEKKLEEDISSLKNTDIEIEKE